MNMLLPKRMSLIVSLTTAVTLACLVVYQTEVINDLRSLLTTTVNKLTETEGLLAIEMSRNEQLEREVLLLTDSINLLNTRIEDFKTEIGDLKGRIATLSKKLAKQDDRLQQLNAELNRMKASEQHQRENALALQQERDDLLLKMETLDRERFGLTNELEALRKDLNASTEQAGEVRQEILEATESKPADEPAPPMTGVEDGKVEHKPAKKLASIVGFTEVRYGEITVRESQSANALRGTAGHNWKYVSINIELENANPEVLQGEQFMVQLYDLDLHKVVPYNEANPAYPDSPAGNKGFVFTYTGEPLGIQYFNSQEKQSSNYEVRLYYYKDNMIYQLRNNRYRIVGNGLIATR